MRIVIRIRVDRPLVLYKIYFLLFTLVATYITFCPISEMHLK